MIIRADTAFFEAMKAAGYDIDRKRLIEIYAQAKAKRNKPSAAAKLEEAGQLRLPNTDPAQLKGELLAVPARGRQP